MNLKMTRQPKRFQNIVNDFSGQGLELKISKTPVAIRSNNAITQIDIKGDAFRLYPGKNKDVHIAVQNAAEGYVLLLVKEPESTFVTQTSASGISKKDRIISTPKSKYGSYTVERILPAGVRKFLMGRDERGLFVSTVNNATTVKSALASLKRQSVVVAEKKSKIVRQGEWYFVPASKTEIAEIERRSIKFVNGNIGLMTKVRNGKPHMAQLLSVAKIGADRPESELGYDLTTWRVAPDGKTSVPTFFAVFVRGKVTHADHASVEFVNWMKVIKNSERPNLTGGNWFD